MSEIAALPIAVVGSATATPEVAELANEVGRLIAEQGRTLLCGGRGGVMEHAARGARAAGGSTLGILPSGLGDSDENPYLDLAIYTGLGQARNQVIVLSAAAVIAIAGGWGSLSEIGLALKHRIPVALLASFRLELPDGTIDPLLYYSDSPADAVGYALENSRRHS